MQKKLDSKSKKLLDYIKYNSQTIKVLMERLLGINIKDIIIYGISEYKKIPEYNFKLIKIKVLLANHIEYDAYLKVTNRYKIDETIFCYYSFCEEKCKNKSTKMQLIELTKLNAVSNEVKLKNDLLFVAIA